ncbi:hypothetical protein Pfo_008945, partial [Paulownia fortunei]
MNSKYSGITGSRNTNKSLQFKLQSGSRHHQFLHVKMRLLQIFISTEPQYCAIPCYDYVYLQVLTVNFISIKCIYAYIHVRMSGLVGVGEAEGELGGGRGGGGRRTGG